MGGVHTLRPSAASPMSSSPHRRGWLADILNTSESHLVEVCGAVAASEAHEDQSAEGCTSKSPSKQGAVFMCSLSPPVVQASQHSLGGHVQADQDSSCRTRKWKNSTKPKLPAEIGPVEPEQTARRRRSEAFFLGGPTSDVNYSGISGCLRTAGFQSAENTPAETTWLSGTEGTRGGSPNRRSGGWTGFVLSSPRETMKSRIDTSDLPNSPGRSHSVAAGACGRDGGGGRKVGWPT